MSKGVVNKFNRGEVSPDVFAREDIDRLNSSCELMENFLPERLGPMAFRPGMEFLGIQDDSTLLVPFVSATDDAVIVEISTDTDALRFLVDGEYQQSTAVTTTMGNPTFSTDSVWVDSDESGATSTITGGQLVLRGTGTAPAKRYQAFTADTGNLHHLYLKIPSGSVRVQIGLGTTGDESDIFDGTLDTGTHFLAFTPTANFTMTLSNDGNYEAKINETNFLGTGDILLTTSDTPFSGLTATDLDNIRWAQSADVLYMVCKERGLAKLERRGTSSWGFTRVDNSFGPYDFINSTSVTLTPAANSGPTTITASLPIFSATAEDYLNMLIKYVSNGQNVTKSVTADDDATDGIFVFGTGDARNFTIDFTSSNATPITEIHLEKSFDEISWQKVQAYLAKVDDNFVFNDGLDAAEIYYRLRVETIGGGLATISVDYSYGSIEGQARVIGKNSDSELAIKWEVDAGKIDASIDWYLGSWYGKGVIPTSIAMYEGRLWLAGGNKIWGSKADDYTNFERFEDGDASAIQKTLGFGPVDDALWLAPSTKLVMGIASGEITARSTSFGEVLTDTNTNLKASTTYGTSKVRPIVMDDEIMFVQRGGDKIINLRYSSSTDAHSAADLNTLNPEILSDGVKRIDIARNPETRVFMVMNDGTVKVLLRDANEDVQGWSRITVPDALIKDVCVIPAGSGPDQVYFTIELINGSRYLHRLANLTDVTAGVNSKHLDSFTYHSSPGNTITGITRFPASSYVSVWADGVDLGLFQITAQQITGLGTPTDVYIGLPYVAAYTSNILFGYEDVSVLGANKRIINTGLIMKNYAVGTVTLGPSFSSLGNMPELENGKASSGTSYNFFPFEFDGISEEDPRINIQATGPCKILALTYEIKNTANRTKREKSSDN